MTERLSRMETKLDLLVRTPACCATAEEEVMLPEQLQILWRVIFLFYPVE